MEQSDADLIAAVLRGDPASFEPLVVKYSPRVFATARRYARRQGLTLLCNHYEFTGSEGVEFYTPGPHTDFV